MVWSTDIETRIGVGYSTSDNSSGQSPNEARWRQEVVIVTDHEYSTCMACTTKEKYMMQDIGITRD